MNGFEHVLFQTVRTFVDYKQHLLATGDSHRRNKSSTHRQLVAPRLGHRIPPGCSDDGGVRRPAGVAEHSIAEHQVHIGQPKRAQVVTRFLVQATNSLQRVDLAGQQTQHSRLVATPRAYFQHPPKPSRTCDFGAEQQFTHAGNDAGFGDGLAHTDGQTGVFIGLVAQGAVHKPVALYLAHGLQHLG